jgi:Domain of unknown function (DUF4387)
MKTIRTIGDVANLVRSKNAGPFWQTLDIFCDSDDDYRDVAAPSVVSVETIASLYHVDATTVRIYRMPALRAIKISFPRPTAQGGIHDRDLHAGQQHVPLLSLELPNDTR